MTAVLMSKGESNLDSIEARVVLDEMLEEWNVTNLYRRNQDDALSWKSERGEMRMADSEQAVDCGKRLGRKRRGKMTQWNNQTEQSGRGSGRGGWQGHVEMVVRADTA